MPYTVCKYFKGYKLFIGCFWDESCEGSGKVVIKWQKNMQKVNVLENEMYLDIHNQNAFSLYEVRFTYLRFKDKTRYWTFPEDNGAFKTNRHIHLIILIPHRLLLLSIETVRSRQNKNKRYCSDYNFNLNSWHEDTLSLFRIKTAM